MKRRMLILLLLVGLVVGMLAAPGAALASGSSVSAAASGSAAAATRAQFAMIAVNGFGLSAVNSPTETYSDVPRGNAYYSYIEGATAAGLIHGLGAGVYGPDLQISRQQVATVLARYLSAVELSNVGYVTGSTGVHYASLDAWYAAEGEAQLAAFSDQASILTVHRPGVAYLAMHGVALGSSGAFIPLSAVTVSQCETFVARAAEVAAGFSQQAAAPTVTSVSPATGSADGGTTVYIYGANFTSDSTVYFGSRAASSVVVSSSSVIVAVSPYGTAGTTVQVSVTTSAGTSANTSADDFTYKTNTIPTITSISPATGSAEGGTTVYIYGANFTSDSTVYFGSRAASSVVVSSSSVIVAVSPYGTAGTTVQVSVTTSAGTSANTSADDFTYKTSVPTVTSVSPDSGEEGDSIYIYGTNFDDDYLEVWFGSSEVDESDIDYYSSTTLLVTVPEHYSGDSETVRVKIISSTGTSANTSADDFTYEDTTDAPTITSLTPAAGDSTGGETVTIKGTNFGDDEDDITVYFGDQEADIDSVNSSGTTLKVEAPEGTEGTTVRVSVVTDDGTSANTLADDYAYGLPTIASIVPTVGTSGITAIIWGTGFSGTMDVYFDGTKLSSSKVTVNGPTKMTVTVPSGTDGETVEVYVANDCGSSGTVDFEYDKSLPTIKSLSKNAGTPDGGNTITITGTHFTSSATVTFGSTASDDVTYVSSTSLKAEVPSGTEGETVDVYVTTTAGDSANTPADDYAYGKPVVESIDPTEGTSYGGTEVTITGTGFTPDVTVKFGSTTVDSSDFVVNSPTSIAVIAPAGTGGKTVYIYVTNDYGTSTKNTDAGAFTYDDDADDEDAPDITSLSDDEGEEGDYIYIYGTDFSNDGLEIYFGQSQADEDYITYYSSTKIKVRVPEFDDEGDETVYVVVVTDDGESDGDDDDAEFTYEDVDDEDAPDITSLSDDEGEEGDYIYIYGTDFSNDGLEIYFGQSQADEDYITYYSSTKIKVRVPEFDDEGDETVYVVVVTDDGESDGDDDDAEFTYTDY